MNDLKQYVNSRAYEWQDIRTAHAHPVPWNFLRDAEAASAAHDSTRLIELRGNRDEEFKAIVREARAANMRLAQYAYRRIWEAET